MQVAFCALMQPSARCCVRCKKSLARGHGRARASATADAPLPGEGHAREARHVTRCFHLVAVGRIFDADSPGDRLVSALEVERGGTRVGRRSRDLGCGRWGYQRPCPRAWLASARACGALACVCGRRTRDPAPHRRASAQPSDPRSLAQGSWLGAGPSRRDAQTLCTAAAEQSGRAGRCRVVPARFHRTPARRDGRVADGNQVWHRHGDSLCPRRPIGGAFPRSGKPSRRTAWATAPGGCH
jgi:hypothetical protein